MPNSVSAVKTLFAQRSYSEVPEVTTSTHEFWRDTVQSIIMAVT
jgi:hypothetical protein